MPPGRPDPLLPGPAMRSRLLLIPAAIVAAAPAQAETYMTLERAQKLLFPGATLTERFVTLNQDQYNKIIGEGNVEPYGRKLKLWKASTGGWFILDQVRGKNDWISYAVALDDQGAVKGVEILECLEKWDGIRNPAWLAQFSGKQHRALFTDIQIISGSTLSSEQIANGVKRLLATYAHVIAPMAAAG
jgi:hypothetical protein